jgi:hypothetical protein
LVRLKITAANNYTHVEVDGTVWLVVETVMTIVADLDVIVVVRLASMLAAGAREA